MDLRERLRDIQARIKVAAIAAGRPPDEIQLVAVAKTFPAEMVQQLVDEGHHLIGENYVQEFLSKAEQVYGATWHFIGHLQSNKVKKVVGQVAMIHSVDRLSLAEEISARCMALQKVMPILIEVNLGSEISKSGVTPEEVVTLAQACSRLPGVQVRGLMALPPPAEDPESSRPHFRHLRQLAEVLKEQGLVTTPVAELSMGMSQDFEVAISEGATLIRVGTSLFGPRG